MIEVVAGDRAPVATVVPIRGAGRVAGHLAHYNTIIIIITWHITLSLNHLVNKHTRGNSKLCNCIQRCINFDISMYSLVLR